jgi:hypothetical protein
MKALVTILLTFASLVGCPQAPNKAAEELDIRETTFRYQFGKNASGQQQSAKSFYLAVSADDKQTDPDDAFIERFAGNEPPVKKVSECDSSGAGVVDKKTGESGLIFKTGAIKWVSDTEVEISGGYYEAGLSASGNTYYLKKVNGKWTVIKDVMHWISYFSVSRLLIICLRQY